MKLSHFLFLSAFGPLILVGAIAGCQPEIQSASGTRMATVGKLAMDADGHTTEQSNIIAKIKADNDPNKVWYLYVISPYTGKVIMKSIVKGKLSSSSKRLTPKHISTSGAGMQFPLSGGDTVYTDEMIAEDGSFGDSSEYMYWKDDKGGNRRHYPSGLHASDRKLTNADLPGAED